MSRRLENTADATRPGGERARWLVVAGIAGLVVIAAGLVAADGTVPGWEESLFHAVNDLPDWLEGAMWLFQLAGLLLVPLIVAAGAAVLRRWYLAATLVVFVPLKLLVEHAVVKQLVERERPGSTICGAPDSFDTECGNFRGDVPLEGLSFVSGHAIIAWGVATVLWPALPGRWRWIPMLVASLNAVARVYLGAHNPLDVIAGASIGITIGALLVAAVSPSRLRQRGLGSH